MKNLGIALMIIVASITALGLTMEFSGIDIKDCISDIFKPDFVLRGDWEATDGTGVYFHIESMEEWRSGGYDFVFNKTKSERDATNPGRFSRFFYDNGVLKYTFENSNGNVVVANVKVVDEGIFYLEEITIWGSAIQKFRRIDANNLDIVDN
jgi:hypothetical protein